MDISARAFSLTDRPRSGHLGHQCSHALGRPNLHLVSSSRRPRLETVDRVTSSLAPHYRAVPLFEPGAVPSSRSAERRSRRAQGRSRPAVAPGLRLAPALPGCALTAPSTAASIKRVGRLHRRSSSARRRVPWPAPPRRCGQACWRARSRARCGATASWRLRSRI